ncbi:unnamed protein product [Caenorhabditis auriculariae]|uniref:ATPase inhibitor, mitochondrial n=1 Tax=Caenorhabditis auriculariae TaxID=2777116 RepID=A0A8S1GWB6_9PELO|nr:unnamed protein product [Caenorhabditis auriculariae]
MSSNRSDGAIYEEGGALGKLGAAREAAYFQQKDREQIEQMRQQIQQKEAELRHPEKQKPEHVEFGQDQRNGSGNR